MNSFNSAIRRYRRVVALALLPLLALIGGVHPARANGVFGSLTNGGIAYGTVSGTGVDQYTFVMPTGTNYYTIMIWESGGHSTTSNAEFWTTNPSGTNSFKAGDGNYDYGQYNIGTGGNTGTWTLKVDNYQNSSTAAAYGVQVAWWPGTQGQAAGQSGGTMRNGETYSGTIGIGETDFYTFQGTYGQNYTYTITKTSGGSGFCPSIQFFSPTATNAGSDATCTTSSAVKWPLSTGTGYIYVDNTYNGNGTGSYTLQITGAAVDMPSQGKGDGSACTTCHKNALAARSGEVTSTGAAATKK